MSPFDCLANDHLIAGFALRLGVARREPRSKAKKLSLNR